MKFFFHKIATIKRWIYKLSSGLRSTVSSAVRVGSGRCQAENIRRAWGRQVVSTLSLTFIKPKANPAFKYTFPLASPTHQLCFTWEPVKQEIASLGMVRRISHLKISQGMIWSLNVCSCVFVCVNIFSTSKVSLWAVLL